jgi:hypothetical protein
LIIDNYAWRLIIHNLPQYIDLFLISVLIVHIKHKFSKPNFKKENNICPKKTFLHKPIATYYCQIWSILVNWEDAKILVHWEDAKILLSEFL